MICEKCGKVYSYAKVDIPKIDHPELCPECAAGLAKGKATAPVGKTKTKKKHREFKGDMAVEGEKEPEATEPEEASDDNDSDGHSMF